MRRILLPILTFLAAWTILATGIHFLTQGNTLGTDFYIFYTAGRTAFIDHADPYTDQQAQQNQLAIFKRLAEPGEDQLGFAYPPYVLLAVWPLLRLSFAWAQAMWAAFLIIGLVAAIILAFKGAPPWVNFSFLLFYPVTFGLILGNFSILMGGAILLIFGLSNREQLPNRSLQIIMGILLAWLTSKPQFVWLYVILFLVWGLKMRWWPLLASFGASLLAFVALSFIVVPGWPGLWLESLTKYAVYNQSWVILAVLFKEILPPGVVTPVTLFLAALILAMTGWLFIQWWQGHLDSLLLLAWCGFVVFALHPRGKSYEHIVFLLPMVAWACREKVLRSPAGLVFWLGSLIVSWAAFFISRQAGAPSSATEWPLLFYAVWLGWMFLKKPTIMPEWSK
ncbi:MAG: DUF2029 domain-containing protein [Methanothrix sp.]|nr:DUF2029 domain-containing protein [Methanothrix sp.]